MRHLTVVIFAALALCRCATAGSPETFGWQSYIAPDQAIEIRGVNGGIRVEPADGTIAEVVATKSGRHPDPASIRIEIEWSDQGVLICTVYPTSDGQEFNPCHPENHSANLSGDAKVDFVVHIPAQTRLKYRAVNGSVYADVPNNRIDAELVNGRVVIATGTSARAALVNGSIIATLGAVDGCGCDFTTVTGTIDVSLPATVNARAKATALVGTITTDFPIRVHRSWISSWFDDAIGTSGPDVSMSVVTGSVHLRRTQQ